MLSELYGVVTYIMPSATSGVARRPPSLAVPVCNARRSTSRPTLPRWMRPSGAKRWLASLPPWRRQSVVCARSGAAWLVTAPAISRTAIVTARSGTLARFRRYAA